jgi:hypothetical protein
VAKEIASREPQGIIHQELNAWAIKTVGEASAAGRLPLAYAAGAGDPNCLGVIDQMVGRAGDVVLLHPWMIHGGTTNLSSAPRLMANGMVRVKREVFDREGGARVLRGLVQTASTAEATAAKTNDCGGGGGGGGSGGGGGENREASNENGVSKENGVSNENGASADETAGKRRRIHGDEAAAMEAGEAAAILTPPMDPVHPTEVGRYRFTPGCPRVDPSLTTLAYSA